MKKVLIVSPHFPPINAPDHQRVRMALPYFEEFGWEPHVLSVSAEYVTGVQDPLLEASLPEGISVTRSRAFPENITRYLGLGNLGWRSVFHLGRRGDQLIEAESPDLVYFSTTMFRVLTLGPRWKKRYQVPFVVDYQDPWRSEYYSRPGIESRPPGGKFKHGFAAFTANLLEPRVMREVERITAVSPAYPKMLQTNYPWLSDDRFLVLPFAASERDFEYLRESEVQQNIFVPDEGNEHWIYLGRAADDMHFALRALFSVFSRKRKESGDLSKVQLHFIGTSYASGERVKPAILPLAKEFGLESCVFEHPERVPYFVGLKTLVDASQVLIIGSDDQDYSPSKVFPCLLAGKPIFAMLHEESLALDILRRHSNASLVSFATEDSRQQLESRVETALDLVAKGPHVLSVESSFREEYSARAMTAKLCNFFDQSCYKSHH